MQTYAAMFFVVALCSALFIDPGVKRSVAVIGKVVLAVFAVLFVVTEVLALVA